MPSLLPLRILSWWRAVSQMAQLVLTLFARRFRFRFVFVCLFLWATFFFSSIFYAFLYWRFAAALVRWSVIWFGNLQKIKCGVRKKKKRKKEKNVYKFNWKENRGKLKLIWLVASFLVKGAPSESLLRLRLSFQPAWYMLHEKVVAIIRGSGAWKEISSVDYWAEFPMYTAQCGPHFRCNRRCRKDNYKNRKNFWSLVLVPSLFHTYELVKIIYKYWVEMPVALAFVIVLILDLLITS